MPKQLEVLIKLRDVLTRPLDTIRGRIRAFGDQTSSVFSRAKDSVFNLRSALIVLPGALIAKNFNDAGSSVEQFRVQLRALLGDEAKAEATLQKIREFAAATPLETAEVIQSFNQLTAVGVESAQKVTETLGGVSLVFTKDLRDVTSAFISFEAEVLRRLGIEISRSGDTAILKTKGMRREVENTANAIRSGLLEIWQKKFPDAMELATDTFSARMAVLRSAIFDVGADISEIWLPSVKATLKKLAEDLNANRDKFVASFKTIAFAAVLAVATIRNVFERFFDDEGLRMATEFGAKFVVAFLKGLVGIGLFFARILAEFGRNVDVFAKLVLEAALLVGRLFADGFVAVIGQAVGGFFKSLFGLIETGIKKLAETFPGFIDVARVEEGYAVVQNGLDKLIITNEALLERNDATWRRFIGQSGEALGVLRARWSAAWKDMFAEAKPILDNLAESVSESEFPTKLEEFFNAQLAAIQKRREEIAAAGGGGVKFAPDIPEEFLDKIETLDEKLKKVVRTAKDLGEGLTAGFDAAKKAANLTVGDIVKPIQALGERLKKVYTEDIPSAIQKSINSTQSFKASMRALAIDVLKQIQLMIIKMLVLAAVQRAIGFFGGNDQVIKRQRVARERISRGEQVVIVERTPERTEALVSRPNGRPIPVTISGSRISFPTLKPNPAIQAVLERVAETQTTVERIVERATSGARPFVSALSQGIPGIPVAIPTDERERIIETVVRPFVGQATQRLSRGVREFTRRGGELTPQRPLLSPSLFGSVISPALRDESARRIFSTETHRSSTIAVAREEFRRRERDARGIEPDVAPAPRLSGGTGGQRADVAESPPVKVEINITTLDSRGVKELLVAEGRTIEDLVANALDRSPALKGRLGQ